MKKAKNFLSQSFRPERERKRKNEAKLDKPSIFPSRAKSATFKRDVLKRKKTCAAVAVSRNAESALPGSARTACRAGRERNGRDRWKPRPRLPCKAGGAMFGHLLSAAHRTRTRFVGECLADGKNWKILFSRDSLYLCSVPEWRAHGVMDAPSVSVSVSVCVRQRRRQMIAHFLSLSLALYPILSSRLLLLSICSSLHSINEKRECFSTSVYPSVCDVWLLPSLRFSTHPYIHILKPLSLACYLITHLLFHSLALSLTLSVSFFLSFSLSLFLILPSSPTLKFPVPKT